MGMTIAEKVLARASGQKSVQPGQYVDATIDRMIADEEFYRMHAEAVQAGVPGGIPRIWDPERFHVVLEHFQPALNQVQALRQKKMRELARHYGIKYFRDATCGVIHRIAIEDFVLPGELGVGADSHSCAWGALNCVGTGMGEHELVFALTYGKIWFQVPETIRVTLTGRLPVGTGSKDIALWLGGKYSTEFALYRSLEFTGPGAAELSIDERITLAAHAVELGGKFGLFDFDQKTQEFLAGRQEMRHQLGWLRPVAADPDAGFFQEVHVDLDELEPQVARPHMFENVVPVSKVAGTPVDQAMVGACCNGNPEDLALVARVLKGRKVHPRTRFLVQPNSWPVYRRCMADGTIEQILAAGAQVLAPGCHLCLGIQGTLADGEVCISSTTRNHRGRMGSGEADVYLASPATVAASAVAGSIQSASEVLQ
jgi:3-isopropylmalate/(R)-2-methylmalate dehydratase large subunit